MLYNLTKLSKGTASLQTRSYIKKIYKAMNESGETTVKHRNTMWHSEKGIARRYSSHYAYFPEAIISTGNETQKGQ